MTNPDNIVRVRARNGGRASVYEANGWAQAYTSGLLEGNGVTQNTSADMNVLVGGSANKPDVVLAENASGYRIALDIVGQQAIAITAPASNSRISAIVAYTDDLSLSTTEDTVTGSPASCGLIVVNGTAASTPVEPSDAQIRSAITADGATGSQASYCVIATVLVASNATMITDTLITINKAGLAGTGVVSSDNIDYATLGSNYSTTELNTGYTWVDGRIIYKKTILWGAGPNTGRVDREGLYPNNATILKIEAFVTQQQGGAMHMVPYIGTASSQYETIFASDPSTGKISFYASSDRRGWDLTVTLYYAKNN